jgi:hypothetical protein
MNNLASPYYPPRARWFSPLLNFGSALKRGLALDHVRLPTGVSLAEMIGCLLVPGLAFCARGPAPCGKAALTSCGLLMLVFIVWLGYPAANVAFGLLLTIHSTGVVRLFDGLMSGARLKTRILLSIAVFMAIGLLVYRPAQTFTEAHWLMPLRVNGHVVVAQKLASLRAVQRGEWIAYALPDSQGEGVYVRSGFGLGPVLATAGDRVRFAAGAFEVNGVAHPRLPHMQASGELVIPEKHWFVWPDIAISGHGNASVAGVPATMLRMAMISESQFVGKPFKYWFWRRQLPP